MAKDKLLTVRQAAIELGVSENAIYQAMRRGLIRGMRVKVSPLIERKIIAIPQAELERYRQNHLRAEKARQKLAE